MCKCIEAERQSQTTFFIDKDICYSIILDFSVPKLSSWTTLESLKDIDSISTAVVCFFPEICLLTNAKRVANVRSETFCNLFSLSVEHFNSVLDHYPVMRKSMEMVAADRLNKIAKTSNTPAVSRHNSITSLCNKDNKDAPRHQEQSIHAVAAAEPEHSKDAEYSEGRMASPASSSNSNKDNLLRQRSILLRKYRSVGDIYQTIDSTEYDSLL